MSVHRDNGNFLFLRIVRAPQGDIYVPFPIPGPEGWAPHMSFHKDGKLHHKDFDREFMVRRLAEPNKDFRGTENLVNIAGDPTSGATLLNLSMPLSFQTFSKFLCGN